MKRTLIILAMFMVATAAHAACPTNWEEVPLEHMELTAATSSCPAGTESYYHIDSQCNGNVF